MNEPAVSYYSEHPVEIPMNTIGLKRAQRTLGMTNGEFAKLLGVALPTLKAWINKDSVPLYIAYSIDALLRLTYSDYNKVKLSRGLR